MATKGGSQDLCPPAFVHSLMPCVYSLFVSRITQDLHALMTIHKSTRLVMAQIPGILRIFRGSPPGKREAAQRGHAMIIEAGVTVLLQGETDLQTTANALNLRGRLPLP